MAVETNLPAEGSIGVPLPDGVAAEVAQPLAQETIQKHLALARANERELAPLKWETAAADPKAKAIADLKAQIAALEADGSGVQPASYEVQEPKGVQAAARQIPPQPQAQAVEEMPDKRLFPAASNSDSPSRGVPGSAPVPASRTSAPIGITGGFGESEAEYFPLDGSELKVVCEQLLDEVNNIIQNDLRFSPALTYPRLSARLQLIIEGEASEVEGFVIDRVKTHEKTPLAVAQAHADSVVFVVAAQRREFDEADQVETPADQIRDELHLKKPGKHLVQNGTLQSYADVDA